MKRGPEADDGELHEEEEREDDEEAGQEGHHRTLALASRNDIANRGKHYPYNESAYQPDHGKVAEINAINHVVLSLVYQLSADEIG